MLKTFFDNGDVYEIMWKKNIYCRALGYKHTIRIRNTYFFYTAIMDGPTSLKVTLHVRRLSSVYLLHRKFCLICSAYCGPTPRI
jgi:hypothetical protein